MKNKIEVRYRLIDGQEGEIKQTLGELILSHKKVSKLYTLKERERLSIPENVEWLHIKNADLRKMQTIILGENKVLILEDCFISDDMIITGNILSQLQSSGSVALIRPQFIDGKFFVIKIKHLHDVELELENSEFLKMIKIEEASSVKGTGMAKNIILHMRDCQNVKLNNLQHARIENASLIKKLEITNSKLDSFAGTWSITEAIIKNSFLKENYPHLETIDHLTVENMTFSFNKMYVKDGIIANKMNNFQTISKQNIEFSVMNFVSALKAIQKKNSLDEEKQMKKVEENITDHYQHDMSTQEENIRFYQQKIKEEKEKLTDLIKKEKQSLEKAQESNHDYFEKRLVKELKK